MTTTDTAHPYDAASILPWDRIMVRRHDHAKADPELYCTACDETLCDVEADDDLRALVGVALYHLAEGCEPATDPTTHPDPIPNTDDDDERDAAHLILPGDTVTVFAHPVGLIGTSSMGGFWSGTVTDVEPLTYAAAPVARITATDDDGQTWVRDALAHAVTTWQGYHAARPCDCPDTGHVCCKDCGREVIDLGDYWLHTADPANR